MNKPLVQHPSPAAERPPPVPCKKFTVALKPQGKTKRIFTSVQKPITHIGIGYQKDIEERPPPVPCKKFTVALKPQGKTKRIFTSVQKPITHIGIGYQKDIEENGTDLGLTVSSRSETISENRVHVNSKLGSSFAGGILSQNKLKNVCTTPSNNGLGLYTNKNLGLYIACYDFISSQLSMKKGEKMQVSRFSDTQECEVTNVQGDVGWVPASYITKVENLEKYSWFHGNVTRAEAELSLGSAVNGSFLLRESESNAKPGQFSISLCNDGHVYHYRIHTDPQFMYFVAPHLKFNNLAELVAHHSKHSNGFLLHCPAPNSLQCGLPGCTNRKKTEGGTVHDYCCLDHAQKDAPNRDAKILTSMPEVQKFLQKFSDLKVASMKENDHAKPGGALFNTFRSAMMSLPTSQRNTCLAFHGTSESNIDSICSTGYDQKKRSRQVHGAGEYFATSPIIPLDYCNGGKKLLLNELLLGQNGTHHTTHHTKKGDIVVMKNPAHDLPRFVITFK